MSATPRGSGFPPRRDWADLLRGFTKRRHGHPDRLQLQWEHDDVTVASAGDTAVSRVVKSDRTTVVVEEEIPGWKYRELESIFIAIDSAAREPVGEWREWGSPQVKGEVEVIVHTARYATEEIRALCCLALR